MFKRTLAASLFSTSLPELSLVGIDTEIADAMNAIIIGMITHFLRPNLKHIINNDL